MKKVITLVLVLVLGMSCSSGFGGVESCKTIPDCLHGIVKENKKLADENNALKENNKELQKNVVDLQNKFNCFNVVMGADFPEGIARAEKLEEIQYVKAYDTRHIYVDGCQTSGTWGKCNYNMILRNADIDHRYMNSLASKINEIIKEIETINAKIAVIEKTLTDSAKCK